MTLVLALMLIQDADHSKRAAGECLRDGASCYLRWIVSWAPDAIDTKTGEATNVKEHGGPFAVAVSDDGRLFCGRGVGETIDVWKVATGKRVCVLNGTGPVVLGEE